MDHLGYQGIQLIEVFSQFLHSLSQGLNQNVDHEVFCESSLSLRQQFELGLDIHQQQQDLQREPYQQKGKRQLCPRYHGNAANLQHGCKQRNQQRSYVACALMLNVQLLRNRSRQFQRLDRIEPHYKFYQRSLLLHRESSDHREPSSYLKLYRPG